MIVTACKFDLEYSRVPLQVLTSSFASARVFVCMYSRAFSSLTLASFSSHVGNASLAFTCSHSRLTLMCDIASDTSYLHSFVKLPLSGTVCCLHNRERF